MKTHQPDNNAFWRWTGNIGNVVGIVGTLGSIIAGKTYLVALFAAIVCVSAGIWLTRQQWQRTGVTFVVIGVLSGLASRGPTIMFCFHRTASTPLLETPTPLTGNAKSSLILQQ